MASVESDRRTRVGRRTSETTDPAGDRGFALRARRCRSVSSRTQSKAERRATDDPRLDVITWRFPPRSREGDGVVDRRHVATAARSWLERIRFAMQPQDPVDRRAADAEQRRDLFVRPIFARARRTAARIFNGVITTSRGHVCGIASSGRRVNPENPERHLPMMPLLPVAPPRLAPEAPRRGP